MKNVIVNLAIALVGFSAQASMIESYHADLNQFQIQPGTELSKIFVNSTVSAAVQVTPMLDISVSFFRSYKCPKGLFCPAIAIAYEPVTYTVEKPVRYVGNCKELIFEGEVDQRRVDGSRTKITVIDNTTNICKTYVALPATQVVLELQGPRSEVAERHVLSSDEHLRQSM